MGAIGVALEIIALIYTFAYKNSKYAISIITHILGVVFIILMYSTYFEILTLYFLAIIFANDSKATFVSEYLKDDIP